MIEIKFLSLYRLILDVATLTGAMRVTLANSATGVFSNNNDLYETLRNAGTITGDRVWRMPLWQHFTNEVTSKRFLNYWTCDYYLFYVLI
jgi:leucyl aminopeptidase